MAGRVIAKNFSSLEVRRQVPHFYFTYMYLLEWFMITYIITKR